MAMASTNQFKNAGEEAVPGIKEYRPDKPLCQDSADKNRIEDSSNFLPPCVESDVQETSMDIFTQLSHDDDHQLSYEEFFQTHLSAGRESDSAERTFILQRNLTNTSGKYEKSEFYSEAQNLQLETRTLQQSIEKACKSLAALESRSSFKAMNKGEGNSNLVNGYEERITEIYAVIAELTQKLQCQNNLVLQEESEVISEGSSSESNSSLQSEHPKGDELKEQVAELKWQMKRKDAEIKELHLALSTLSNELERNKHQRCDTKMATCNNQVPVLKVAERIKLKTMDKPVTGYLISNLGVSRTEVAEHLVSDLKENCDIQELKEKHELEVEMERLNAKLEHTRSQNALLQLNFEESKAHCSRLSILIGKYESNIIALKQALDKSDQIVEIYRSLYDAKKSPKHFDEKTLLNKLSKLLHDQTSIKSTVVKLESHITEPLANHVSVADARKLDIETAVLMQELMALREEKAELKAQLFRAEKDREQLELKLFSQQLQCQALTQSDELSDRADRNSTEIRLKEQLKEVALMLERVTRNAELKQQQLGERVNQLKTVNSVLAHSLEKCNQKLQTRVRKVETQMLSMAERHAAQVSNLKQNIVLLEDKVICYENTLKVLENEVDVCRRPMS